MKKKEKPSRGAGSGSAGKIHGKMKLGDVAVKYPQTMEVFFKYGLHCVGCSGASFETIEEGATVHGMTKSETERLLKKLNEVIG